ncbi:hypothetical protein GOBAR_DD09743 [Gossypium barbadense]|nr:hypothetical protein GOBAR_DD09743 [Gossypium barbadense]
MQLLDDDDLGTMMEIWWSTGSENPQPVELFVELADLEPIENDVGDFSDPIVDEVLDDIDDEGPEEVEDVHDPSFSNSSRGIVLQNELGGDILNVDLDATHAFEFPVYANIVLAHRLTSNLQLEELFVGQLFENKAGCVFATKQYNMKLSIDYKGLVAVIQQFEVPWRSVYYIHHITVNFHNEYKNKDWCKQIVKIEYIDHQSRIPLRSYGVDIRNRRCQCEMFQTLRKCNCLSSRCCQIGHYVGKSKVDRQQQGFGWISENKSIQSIAPYVEQLATIGASVPM